MISELASVGPGIYALDSGYGRPRMDAIHVVESSGRVAIVESGTRYSVPAVLNALATLGHAPEAVDWVMLTHVHLDHAGGAGALLEVLPNACLLVHPRGLRHMVDPSKLWEGTVAVYGEAFAREAYGALVPAPAERVVAAEKRVGDRFGRAGDPGAGHAGACPPSRVLLRYAVL